MKKTLDNTKVLDKEELKNFIGDNILYKCDVCDELPYIIEKTIVNNSYKSFAYEYTEKKYKCYCPNCQKGTGFSNYEYYTIKNWNKMVEPIKYKNCYLYSFHPLKNKDENGIVLEDFNIKFKVIQHEIIHKKGGNRFLYYIHEDEERKLDLENFTNNVAIYTTERYTIYDLANIKVCAVIAEDICNAENKLNREMKTYFENISERLYKALEIKERELIEAKQNIEDFDRYMKNNCKISIKLL